MDGCEVEACVCSRTPAVKRISSLAMEHNRNLAARFSSVVSALKIEAKVSRRGIRRNRQIFPAIFRHMLDLFFMLIFSYFSRAAAKDRFYSDKGLHVEFRFCHL